MIDFAIGQRYLSDTESELGLGVVVLVDDRCVHILFPQSEETRVYAKVSAPLSQVMFKTGDNIHDQDGNTFTVTDVEMVSGVCRYHVAELDKPMMENSVGGEYYPCQTARTLVGKSYSPK